MAPTALELATRHVPTSLAIIIRPRRIYSASGMLVLPVELRICSVGRSFSLSVGSERVFLKKVLDNDVEITVHNRK